MTVRGGVTAEKGRNKTMGLMDAFNPEDRVTVTFTDFYKMMREAARSELLQNAVKMYVPHEHIVAMLYGPPLNFKEVMQKPEGGQDDDEGENN